MSISTSGVYLAFAGNACVKMPASQAGASSHRRQFPIFMLTSIFLCTAFTVILVTSLLVPSEGDLECT